MTPSESFNAFSGLDLLSSAVVLVDAGLILRHLNPAAENLFAVSSRQWLGHPLLKLVGEPPELAAALDNALKNNWSYTGHNIRIQRGPDLQLHVDCTVTPVEAGQRAPAAGSSADRPAAQGIAREEQLAQQQQANRELVRNLAHEIKNPAGRHPRLGAVAGARTGQPELKEYTQVIIEEADRLQDLMQRLLSLASRDAGHWSTSTKILERVRRLIHAEYHEVSVRARLRHLPARHHRRSRTADPGHPQHFAQRRTGDAGQGRNQVAHPRARAMSRWRRSTTSWHLNCK
jgi:two-component system nitrogen regulation sensor histidine kinase GlnL